MAVRNVSVLALYNDKGEILLQHRSKTAKRLPDYWGFFGGGIEAGETPEQAVQREITEELEYQVKNPILIYTQEFFYKEDKNTKYVFVEKYDTSQPLIQHEGQNMKWLKYDDMKGLQIVDHDRIALWKVQEYLNER